MKREEEGIAGANERIPRAFPCGNGQGIGEGIKESEANALQSLQIIANIALFAERP